MYKTFMGIITIIWLIDIMNIDFLINGIHVVKFLDKTIPLNFWFWFLFWLCTPNEYLTINWNKER